MHPQVCFSLREIVARKEVKRLKNQGAIQAIVDGVKEKEDDWIAILSLKFEVSKVSFNDILQIDNFPEIFPQGVAGQTSRGGHQIGGRPARLSVQGIASQPGLKLRGECE